ncbi:MAG TPA: glycoside hydrolase family 16 protein [Cytophagaceae bacterium]|jgi:beta-glucanase (GH16 family)|nr:glycoside hydrolase family 16 protein [Cytophagaceae bacterium]
MKKISILLLLSFVIFSCKKSDTTPTTSSSSDYNPGPGWNLAWSDEFDSTALNTSIWNYETGTGQNQELEYYLSQNVSVSNGNLVITALQQNYNGANFTSGKINTQNKYAFKYGKIVGKIKLPQGLGMWPAFWMLGNSSLAWPGCGEIDIMEMQGGQGAGGDYTTLSTCHWLGTYAPAPDTLYGQQYTNVSKLSQAYHYYEVEWNASTITSRFDGIQYNQINITKAEMAPFRNNSFYIILNLAVGGNFFSPALLTQASVTATFPQSMYVDWVRVYVN